MDKVRMLYNKNNIKYSKHEQNELTISRNAPNKEEKLLKRKSTKRQR